jgi:hypothetical protein
MRPIVVFDLDSTIRDTRQRRNLCPTVNPESTWDHYHAAGWADRPLIGGLRLVHLLQVACDIHVVTFAPEWARVATERWIKDRFLCESLHMHDGKYGEDSLQFHVDRVGWLLEQGRQVHLVVQDQPKIAVAIQAEHHIPVLCVNPCYAELSALVGRT